jgi:hypothetical protein
MPTARPSVGIYRRLVVLYPRSFREEYRDDLVALFASQLADESALRVWGRTVRDLLVSVPGQRVEALMRKPSNNLVVAIACVVSLLGSAAAATTAKPLVFFAALTVGLISSLVALWSWQAGRALTAPGSGTRIWWRLLLSGAGCIAIGMAIAAVASDNFAGWYWPWALISLLGLVLGGIGVLFAVAHLVRVVRRRRNPAML